MKKYFGISLKIIVSFALITYLYFTNDFSQIIPAFSNVDLFYFSLSLSFIVLNYIFSSLRWKYLVLNSKVKFSYMVKLYFIGSFFNNFLPTSIGGDAYKILKLGQKIESKTDAFTATFLERFIGMIALLLISIFGLISFKQIDSLSFLGVFILIISAFILFLLFYPKFTFRPKILTKIFGLIDKVHSSFMKYKTYPRILIFSFVSSIFVQLFSVLSQLFIFKSISVDIPFNFALFAFPIIFLSGYAIPSVNGIGSQEVLYTAFFTDLGIAVPLIIASSFLYHIARLLISLIGGLLYINEK